MRSIWPAGRLRRLQQADASLTELLAALKSDNAVASCTAALALAAQGHALPVDDLVETIRSTRHQHVRGSVALCLARTAKRHDLPLAACAAVLEAAPAGVDAYALVQLFKACRRAMLRDSPTAVQEEASVLRAATSYATDASAYTCLHLLRLVEAAPLELSAAREPAAAVVSAIARRRFDAANASASFLEFDPRVLAPRLQCAALLVAADAAGAVALDASLGPLLAGDLAALEAASRAAAADDALLMTLLERLARANPGQGHLLLAALAAAVEWDCGVIVDLLIDPLADALATLLLLFRQCARAPLQARRPGGLCDFLLELSDRLLFLERRKALPFPLAPLLRQLEAALAWCRAAAPPPRAKRPRLRDD